MTLSASTSPEIAWEDIKVAVIDDDSYALMLICQIVTESGFTLVGQAQDGDQAVALVQQTQPDVLLMDVRMQRMNGIEATRAIRQAGLPVGIISLTTFDTDAAIIEATRAGVNGFLEKSMNFAELQNAIINVYKGLGALSGRATQVVLASHGQPEQLEEKKPQPLIKILSQREYEAVQLLAITGGSNIELCQKMMVGERTFKGYLAGASQKLGAENRTQLVVRALQLDPELTSRAQINGVELANQQH